MFSMVYVNRIFIIYTSSIHLLLDKKFCFAASPQILYLSSYIHMRGSAKSKLPHCLHFANLVSAHRPEMDMDNRHAREMFYLGP